MKERVVRLTGLTVLLLALGVLGGCATGWLDPLTGEHYTDQEAATLPSDQQQQLQPQFRMKPQAVAAGDAAATAAEANAPLAPAIGALFGPTGAAIGTAVGGLLLGAAGAWRKLKPQVSEYQNENKIYHNTAAGIVTAIENFKHEQPEAWQVLGPQIEKALGDKGMALIRALRGLPPRE